MSKKNKSRSHVIYGLLWMIGVIPVQGSLDRVCTDEKQVRHMSMKRLHRNIQELKERYIAIKVVPMEEVLYQKAGFLSGKEQPCTPLVAGYARECYGGSTPVDILIEMDRYLVSGALREEVQQKCLLEASITLRRKHLTTRKLLITSRLSCVGVGIMDYVLILQFALTGNLAYLEAAGGLSVISLFFCLYAHCCHPRL